MLLPFEMWYYSQRYEGKSSVLKGGTVMKSIFLLLFVLGGPLNCSTEPTSTELACQLLATQVEILDKKMGIVEQKDLLTQFHIFYLHSEMSRLSGELRMWQNYCQQLAQR